MVAVVVDVTGPAFEIDPVAGLVGSARDVLTRSVFLSVHSEFLALGVFVGVLEAAHAWVFFETAIASGFDLAVSGEGGSVADHFIAEGLIASEVVVEIACFFDVGLAASSAEDFAAFSLSPGVVVSFGDVNVVPPRVVHEGECHFGELCGVDIFGDHGLVAEDDTFPVSALGAVSSVVFEWDSGDRGAVEVFPGDLEELGAAEIVVAARDEVLSLSVDEREVFPESAAEDKSVEDLVHVSGDVVFELAEPGLEVVGVDHGESDVGPFGAVFEEASCGVGESAVVAGVVCGEEENEVCVCVVVSVIAGDLHDVVVRAVFGDVGVAFNDSIAGDADFFSEDFVPVFGD